MREKIKIAGNQVKRVDKIKFLGVLIDDISVFKKHVNSFQMQ